MPGGIGNIRRIDLKSSLRALKDTSTFPIEKSGRFASRGVQISLAFFLCFFVGHIQDLIPQLRSLLSMIWFLLIVGMFASVWNVVIYAIPWMSKKWTSKRILIVETLIDFCFAVMWIVTFIVTAAMIAPICYPGSVTYLPGCTASNWVVSMAFFLTCAWSVSLGLDIMSLYKGIYRKDDVDPAVLLEIHRSNRSNRI